MGPLRIIECDPAVDDAPGMEAVGDLGEIDRFLFQRPPEALDDENAGGILHHVSGEIVCPQIG